jgi:hypothetical protein
LCWVHTNPHDKWGKGENGVFWKQIVKLGSTQGAWNCPKLSIIFPILNIEKTDVSSLLKAH